MGWWFGQFHAHFQMLPPDLTLTQRLKTNILSLTLPCSPRYHIIKLWPRLEGDSLWRASGKLTHPGVSNNFQSACLHLSARFHRPGMRM